MDKRLLAPLFWFVMPLCLLCAAINALPPQQLRPISQQSLTTYTVYAYRDWQSVGIFLEPGDSFTVQAEGEWEYSPVVGRHGPNGGGQWAVQSYPLPTAPGGVLLARIGESATVRANSAAETSRGAASTLLNIGARGGGYAAQPGLLYFRINDDLVGDNAGKLTLTIAVTRMTPAAP
jgi:hypothetical protein